MTIFGKVVIYRGRKHATAHSLPGWYYSALQGGNRSKKAGEGGKPFAGGPKLFTSKGFKMYHPPALNLVQTGTQ